MAFVRSRSLLVKARSSIKRKMSNSTGEDTATVAFSYIKERYSIHREIGSKKPLIVGISALQGCGKTTLTRKLTEQFTGLGLKVVCLSLDDFYLTRQNQIKVSEISNNPLLKYRGNGNLF